MKYYHTAQIFIPVSVYFNNNENNLRKNLETLDSILQKNNCFFNEEDFDVEIENEEKETTGELVLNINVLTPCYNKKGEEEAFESETVPNFLDNVYCKLWDKISKELENIYITDLDSYELYIKYDNALDFSFDDLLLFKKEKIYINTDDKILKKALENIDRYLIEAYLLTENKKFIENIPNAKEKIKNIVENIKDTKINNKDIAKAVEYINKPDFLFIDDEKLKKTVLSLEFISAKKKKGAEKKRNMDNINI